jgi:hypothetical protein
MAHYETVHGQDLNKVKTSDGEEPAKEEGDLCGISDKLLLYPNVLPLKLVEQLVLRKPGVAGLTVVEPTVPIRLRTRLKASTRQVNNALAEAEIELELWSANPANLPQIHHVRSGSDSDSETTSKDQGNPNARDYYDEERDGGDIKYYEHAGREHYIGTMAMASAFARLERISCIVKHPAGHWVVLRCPICSGNSRSRDLAAHFLSGVEGFIEHFKHGHSRYAPCDQDPRLWILNRCAEKRETIDPRIPPIIERTMVGVTTYKYRTPSPARVSPLVQSLSPTDVQSPGLPTRIRDPEVDTPQSQRQSYAHREFLSTSRHMMNSTEPQYE